MEKDIIQILYGGLMMIYITYYSKGIDYKNIKLQDYTLLEVDKNKASNHKCVYTTGHFL